MQAVLIIAILVAVAAIGFYYYPKPSMKKKLVVDFWYESSGHWPQNEDQAMIYKTQLERTGVVTVDLHAAEWPSYRNNRFSETMPMYMGSWSPDYIDPDAYLYPVLHSTGSGWLNTNYKNPEMDRLIEQARVTSDPSTRNRLYDQVQKMMVDDAPVVPIYQMQTLAVTKPDLKGVVLDIMQNIYFWLIESPRDTLIVGTSDSIGNNIDVAEAYDFMGEDVILNTGAGLVYVKPGSAAGPEDLLPGLATSWFSSTDDLTWTFNLRQGVKFSDGREFAADSVKYSFDRSMNLYLADGPQAAIGYRDIISSVEVTSKYQVTFHLKIPFAPFLSLMAFQGSYMVNPNYAPKDRAVDYVEGDARASNPNDLGPYLLTSWTRKAGKDYEIRYDINPNYWGIVDGYPKTKHIILKFFPDSTALALAMRSANIDMAYRYLQVTDIKNFEADPAFKVWKGNGAFEQYICFQEKTPPFDNPKVRQAIAAALNRKELVDTVFLGQALPLYSLIPNGMTFQSDGFNTLGDANIAFTVKTLKELGYG
jgi:ABC-type transport system substrate-binding protein